MRAVIVVPLVVLLLPLGTALTLPAIDLPVDPQVPGGRDPSWILVVQPGRLEGVSALLVRLGLEHHTWPELSMATVVGPRAVADRVAQLAGVEAVHANERLQPLLDQSASYVGARVVADQYGVTGKGVTVLVVDSGVDGNHPDVQYRSNLVENVVVSRHSGGLVKGSREGIASSDPDGHGTHVAAIVGGTSRASESFAPGKYRGVAPGARLIGYQAGLADETGDVSFESVTVLEAFNWAIANRAKYGIRVVSNSWGANGEFDPRSPINIATFNLYKAGLLVVFAAGNEGAQGGGTMNKYSVAPWVLSVAAGDYVNNVPRFSSRGSDARPYDHPDLVAPGLGITSARARSVAPAGADPETKYYSSKSGSSMAAPHVAGVAALLLEANPRLSPDDVMDILTATATPMPRFEVWEAGAGYVNALQALQLAKRSVGHRDEFLAGSVKYAGPASGDAKYARDAVSVGYLRGSSYRLGSPAVSFVDFTARLFSTWDGGMFLGGSLFIGALAFGLQRRPAAPLLVARLRRVAYAPTLGAPTIRLTLAPSPVPQPAAPATNAATPLPSRPPGRALPPPVARAPR